MRCVFAHLVQNAAFGGNDKLCGIALERVFEENGRRAHLVGHESNRTLALGMNKHRSIGMFGLEASDILHAEAFMHMTGAIPQQHVAAGYGIYVSAEIAVGTENQLCIDRKTVYHLARVPDVTRTSLRAFTSTDVLTYEMTV